MRKNTIATKWEWIDFSESPLFLIKKRWGVRPIFRNFTPYP
ncbi:hypothetical protein LEP1GSC199_1970 [Leptospira vanthielii serovar Holland str. Waz Holland = ATCC 700522]|uniref:Uncharacterized protein n=1 Tax=Leptospira vanthielii serovar Holland str. Waz Holland = ATCC 700522 TaxID=1218591 RepID=N1W409_9LEPT|nr:hypothetical protein LEP1GSC199_1970 [Leptospira vanthielii serovar Holland str. Waz Holland = ATCC 700522]